MKYIRNYNEYRDRESLVTFMSAYDNGDLPDGAWQAMLEDGAEEFTRTTGIQIEPIDAFHEYLASLDDDDEI